MEARIQAAETRFAPVVPADPYSYPNSTCYKHHLNVRRARDSLSERLFFLFVTLIGHFVRNLNIAVIGDANVPVIMLAADRSNADEVEEVEKENANRDDIRNFMVNYKSAVTSYLLDLVAAYQVRKLTSDQLDSYAAAAGGEFPETIDIMEVLPYAAARFPKIMNTPALRADYTIDISSTLIRLLLASSAASIRGGLLLLYEASSFADIHS